MKIVLLGYMGSGKTTIAKLLEVKTNLKYIDLDEYISEKEGISINNIFKQKGEIYFRTIENKYLTELLNQSKSFILAVGGGTPCYANNMDLIANKSISIYLKANLNLLVERLEREKQNRPLISELSNSKLKEFIAKHLFERAPFYENAQFDVQIDKKSKEEIVNEIVSLIKPVKMGG